MKKIILIILINIVVLSASEIGKYDSLKTYQLGEVEITDTRGAVSKINKASVIDVPHYIIQNSDLMSAANLQYLIPSSAVRTNSRGESMMFLRGAGERQLGLFFDGMSMNIPWDNRMDLTFVPTDIIGNIRVNKSASSMLYGPNILGGAINISTIERSSEGYGLTLKGQFGDGNSQNYSIIHDGKIGKFNYITNISYMSTDGFMMSSNAPDDLGNQNNNSSLRTNTDQERWNYYGRMEYHFSEKAKIGASVIYTKQNKGVAPETYAGEDARFWRFPVRERTSVILNGSFMLSQKLNLKTTIWQDVFAQTIEDYPNINYDFTTDMSQESDDTFGSRISLNYLANDNNRISFVLNGFTTDHNVSEFIDYNFHAQGEYQQHTISTGAEYSGFFDILEVNAGAGYDYNITPKTGEFTESENNSQKDFAGFLSLKYFINDDWAITASTSRRTRFPTMREQYDGALGKFKTNPDLKAETGLLNEAGFIYAIDKFNIKAVAFYNLYDNMIERIRLSYEQDTLQRRMRVNYGSAEISGVDVNFHYKPISNIFVDGFFTYMNTSAEQDGEDIEHLVQKPSILAGINSAYRFSFGLRPSLELEYTGEMWDNDENGEYISIDPSVILNLRIGYDINIADLAFTEFFVRLNNITDEYKLSQYGLPEPGRTLYAGFVVRL